MKCEMKKRMETTKKAAIACGRTFHAREEVVGDNNMVAEVLEETGCESAKIVANNLCRQVSS